MTDPFQTKIFGKLKEKLKAKKSSSKEDFHVEELWGKFKSMFPRQTPVSWVDHSEHHVLKVLEILDSVIPDKILNDLSIEELFLLITGTISHDIGMVKASGLTDILGIADVRRKHGELGANLLREEFSSLIPQKYLSGLCEVVKYHHGNFEPSISISIPNVPSIPQLALIVRLADELDFGPGRAPNWLADIIGLSQDQIIHWQEHNRLQPPQIIPKVLRIYLSGYCKDRNFVEKIINEFNNQLSVNLQVAFFGKGGSPFPYIIQNETIYVEEKEHATSRIFYIDPSYGSKLELARNLYNDGRYEWSLFYFKNIFRNKEDYTKYPSYVYHYLKTYEKLGDYEQLLILSNEILLDLDNSELEADIRSTRSVAYYKLCKFDEGINESLIAEKLYDGIENKTLGGMIKHADQHTITSILQLAKFRIKRDSKLLFDSKSSLQKAEQHFGATKEEHETHYFGRFFGMKAFLLLGDIENEGESKIRDSIEKDSNLWAEAEGNAVKAFGGKDHTDRNIAGIFAGTYVYASVQLHRCQYLVRFSKSFHTIYISFYDLSKTIDKLYNLYSNIFGNKTNWFMIKINTLSKNYDLLLTEIKINSASVEALSELKYFNRQLDEELYNNWKTLIYTPIQ